MPKPDSPFKMLVAYNRPYWKSYLLGSVLAVVVTTFGLASPLIIRRIISGFEDNTMTGSVLMMGLAGLLGASVISGGARYIQRMAMIGASRRFEYDLRNHLFSHVMRLPSSFFGRTQTGDIMARATSDVNNVREFVGPGIMGSVDMISIPATLGVMIWLTPKLTLVTMIPLPFVSLLAYGFIRYMNKQSKVVQELFSTMSSRMQENLAGARVVKAYGIADRESRSFLRDANDYMHANIKLVAIMSCALPMVAILVGIFVIIIMGQGGSMVIRGELSLGNLTSFIICMVMLAFPLAQLGYVLTLYQRGAVSMARIGTILAEECEDRGGETDLPVDGKIAFENVSFSYEVFAMRDKRKRKSEEADADKKQNAIAISVVLRDLSFTIEPGQTMALVGPTGAGKSTLAGLVTRAYDPTGGRILLDGRDLKEIPLGALRQALGFVPQDTFAFSDSIRANLMLARPGATEQELLEACGVAQLSEALERFPKGMDTLLGERGINLSGGQKQRLTLARAILRDPAILVLDDALSSVDTHTEERILAGLRRVLAGRTALIISHRVSTLRYADQILVLGEDPRGGYTVTERGTHDELMTLDGAYAALYRRQLLESALEDELEGEA